MKFTFRVACIVSLAALSASAWALQLGQIQVRSALNQPLVAAIPLHPENLTELDGLNVELASAADFEQAGLQITAVDRTLRFHVVTDNNGQKLILVTSSQPVTDPYLDFLVQVNTRRGKQVQEFVVLLNPVIAAPAPEVQTAPVAAAPQPVRQPAAPTPTQLPPASAFPQAAAKPATAKSAAKPARHATPASRPVAKPALKPEEKPAPPPKPAPAPQQAAVPAGSAQGIEVAHGDTLYGIAQKQTQGSKVSINRMMLALKGANPEAFFKDNINDLKAGAILRIPTRDQIDAVSLAEANAEVHRQYEAWRAARPHPATVIEGTATEAAAKAAPKPEARAPASDHLTLVPASGEGGGVGSRAGVAGGTGTQTVAGLHQQLQNDRDALVSLKQANADLGSRVQSLKDMTGKTDKLLSFKDATIADLQQRLAALQAGKPGAGAPPATGGTTAATVAKAKSVATTPAEAVAKQWYERPLAWLVAGLVVLALLRFGWSRRRRGGRRAAVAAGPLPDPEDIVPQQSADDDGGPLQADVAVDPSDLHAHLALCKWYYNKGNVGRFIAAAQAMHPHVDRPDDAEWRAVAMMGAELAPKHPLFVHAAAAHEDPYGITELRQPVAADEPTVVRAVPRAPEPASSADSADAADAAAAEEEPMTVEPMPPAVATEPSSEMADDPVDTKLDLARAYLDMGDPVGARAMLEEVLEEGSQPQKDEAKRLLADVAS